MPTLAKASVGVEGAIRECLVQRDRLDALRQEEGSRPLDAGIAKARLHHQQQFGAIRRADAR